MTKLETLEKQVKAQEKELTTLKDIEAIKKLEKAYGYYVEHMMYQEIVDCFSDSPDVVLNWLEGNEAEVRQTLRCYSRPVSAYGVHPEEFSLKGKLRRESRSGGDFTLTLILSPQGRGKDLWSCSRRTNSAISPIPRAIKATCRIDIEIPHSTCSSGMRSAAAI